MIYRKRLNNNVVVAQDERGREVILTGKGLRFAMPACSKYRKVEVIENRSRNRQMPSR